MENLVISINTVGPIFCFLMIGLLVRWAHLLDESAIQKMMRLTNLLFLPMLLFKNIISCGGDVHFEWRLILTATGASTAACLLSCFIACLCERDFSRRAALAQGMFRNNYVAYGVQIASSIYGPGTYAVALVSMLSACIVPLNNIYAVVVLTAFRNGRLEPRRLLRQIVRNPYVIAAGAGFLYLALPCFFPPMLRETVDDLGNVAIPLSMLLLGATFSFRGIGGYVRDIAAGSFAKLVLMPAIFVPLFAAFGVRNEALLALLIAMCTPPAASTHIMAREMGADGTLAGHLIVFASALSVITIFGWVLALQTLGLI